MFVRTNIVQNGVIKVSKEKTDEELMNEIDEEKNRGLIDYDADDYDGFMHYYIQLSVISKEIAYGKYEQIFNYIMIVSIILAGLLVGLQTYPSLTNNRTLGILESVVLVLFSIECILKILAEGPAPLRYFYGRRFGLWNTFDFIIILICMPFFSSLSGNNSSAIRIVSRLFRLLRIVKIFEKIPALQMVLNGLVGGMKSISFIFILLVLVFYIYACVGVFTFRENNPFFFQDVATALLTLFHACTLENWGANLYIDAYGCDNFDGGYYIHIGEVTPQLWSEIPMRYKCLHSKANPFAYVYWVSFTVISSLVMLSLFVGVITMSMQQSLEEMRTDADTKNRKKRLQKQQSDMEALALKARELDVIKGITANLQRRQSKISRAFGNDTGMEKKLSCGNAIVKYIYSKLSTKERNSVQDRKKLKDMAEMKSLLMQAWSIPSGTSGAVVFVASVEKRITKYASIARRVTENPMFIHFITVVILLTAVLVGVETDNSNPSEKWAYRVSIIEWLICAIFAVEVFLRMLAEEFHFDEFFSNRWNVFDFVVVVGSLFQQDGNAIIVMLRLLRLLRVLKLIKSLPQLAVIVNALLMGLSSIGYIGVIISLAYYLFAILGVILFKDNDPYNFGDLMVSLSTLFRVATLDNWGDVMFKNIYGCDEYPPTIYLVGQLTRCDRPHARPFWTVLFFVVFIIIGALVMLTLFVGVVTTSMEEATKQQLVEQQLQSRILSVCKEEMISTEQLDIYRRVFGMLDLDGGGTIEPKELELGLNCVHIYPNAAELIDWVKEVDINFDGVVDMVEFITFMTNMKKKKAEELQRKAEVHAKATTVLWRYRYKKKKEKRLSTELDGDTNDNSDSTATTDQRLKPKSITTTAGGGNGKASLLGTLGKSIRNMIVPIDDDDDDAESLSTATGAGASPSSVPVKSGRLNSAVATATLGIDNFVAIKTKRTSRKGGGNSPKSDTYFDDDAADALSDSDASEEDIAIRDATDEAAALSTLTITESSFPLQYIDNNDRFMQDTVKVKEDMPRRGSYESVGSINSMEDLTHLTSSIDIVDIPSIADTAAAADDTAILNTYAVAIDADTADSIADPTTSFISNDGEVALSLSNGNENVLMDGNDNVRSPASEDSIAAATLTVSRKISKSLKPFYEDNERRRRNRSLFR